MRFDPHEDHDEKSHGDQGNDDVDSFSTSCFLDVSGLLKLNIDFLHIFIRNLYIFHDHLNFLSLFSDLLWSIFHHRIQLCHNPFDLIDSLLPVLYLLLVIIYLLQQVLYIRLRLPHILPLRYFTIIQRVLDLPLLLDQLTLPLLTHLPIYVLLNILRAVLPAPQISSQIIVKIALWASLTP